MTIKVGDKIPSATLKQLTPEGPKDITTDELFRGKKVALFAVPGAFTPACSQRHLPGYVEKAADIKAKGIDEIACVAVNDACVMGAWGKDAEGRRQGDDAGRWQRRFRARRRARARSDQGRARHALASAIRCWSTTAS